MASKKLTTLEQVNQIKKELNEFASEHINDGISKADFEERYNDLKHRLEALEIDDTVSVRARQSNPNSYGKSDFLLALANKDDEQETLLLVNFRVFSYTLDLVVTTGDTSWSIRKTGYEERGMEW